jgi:DNA-binding Lrp family transcriptional regulator
MAKMTGDVKDLTLDPVDERIIHAVQVAPRAPWSTLAPVVGISPVTMARRWEQLRARGTVYVTGYGWNAGAVLALIAIECRPGLTLDVARELAEDREAFTIDLTAGGRDIMVSLLLSDTRALASWTFGRIQQVKGIRSVRTHLVSDIVTDARGWQLRALSRDEVATIRNRVRTPAVSMPRLTGAEMEGVVEALAVDGRASATDIAVRAGISARRARETVAAMMATPRYSVRVDVVREQTPWPVYIWYFLQVPADKVAKVGPLLSRLPEARLVVTTASQYNVIMAAWLRSLHDVQEVEGVLEERLPGVRILDRSVVLGTVKHLGHIIDDDGYATGETVPMP